MSLILYRVGTAILVLSLAGSGALAQSSAGRATGSMMGGTSGAGMMGNAGEPASTTPTSPDNRSSPPSVRDQTGEAARGGYGYGPWMMGRGGYRPGPWMMNGGWMGPQMMGWGGAYGGYGPCGGSVAAVRQADLNLSVAQVKSNMERLLALDGNPHIKLGAVVEKTPNTITADIVTIDKGGLVQRFEINRKTGFVQPAGE